MGQLLYTFESVGTIFSVRDTLKRPRKMRKVLFWTYALLTILIMINSIVFLLTYGKDGLKEIAFDYFTYDVSLTMLEWLFYLTLPCIVFICLLSNSMELENTLFVQKLLRNDFGVLMISRLMLF